MDYPYKDWKLRCVDDSTAILDLTTKRLSLVFEIGPLYIKLIECQAKELSHLLNIESHPGFLFQELSKCGVHLLPRDEDAKLAGIDLKDRAAEERAILDVCINVRAIHFRKSKWNQGTPGNEGVGSN
jgi:cancer susceptibility candidate protein 1